MVAGFLILFVIVSRAQEPKVIYTKHVTIGYWSEVTNQYEYDNREEERMKIIMEPGRLYILNEAQSSFRYIKKLELPKSKTEQVNEYVCRDKDGKSCQVRLVLDYTDKSFWIFVKYDNYAVCYEMED